MLSKTELTNDSARLKANAHQNPSTSKPGTSPLTNMIIKVLITNRNKPKVTIVMGMVSKTRIGLSNIFTIAKTPATTSAVKNPLTWAPGSI